MKKKEKLKVVRRVFNEASVDLNALTFKLSTVMNWPGNNGGTDRVQLTGQVGSKTEDEVTWCDKVINGATVNVRDSTYWCYNGTNDINYTP